MKDLVTIGRIVKPVGLKGRMKVISFLASPLVLEKQPQVFIGDDRCEPARYAIQKISVKGNTFQIVLEEISTIEAADLLKGQLLYLPRHALDSLEDDEYYWHDIIGLAVVTAEGERLGVITSIIPTGSNDVYVCEGPEGELLLPATEGFIKEIDLAGGYMVVERPLEL